MDEITTSDEFLQAWWDLRHILSSDWLPDVLVILHRRGSLRYSELLAAVRDEDGIDRWSQRPRTLQDRTLHRTLGRLHHDGLITRHEEPGTRPRAVTYGLTPAAEQLMPAVVPAVRWVQEHRDLIEKLRSAFAQQTGEDAND